MLTLPAEVISNKDNVSIEPILIIDFVDIDYCIASRAFNFVIESGSGTVSFPPDQDTFIAVGSKFLTKNVRVGDKLVLVGAGVYSIDSIDNETTITTTTEMVVSTFDYEIRRVCVDLLKKGESFGIQSSLPELVNSMSSVSNVSFNLTDFRTTLRNSIIGTTPDLTDSTVDVYIKFDSSNGDKDKSVQIYHGAIASYKIHRDIMSITLKYKDIITGSYPGNLLVDDDSRSVAGSTITKPLQYGDFNWDYNMLYLNDAKGKGGLAICPIHLAAEDNGAVSVWELYVAKHKMKNIHPWTYQAWTSTTDQAEGPNFFIYRGNELLYVYINAFGPGVITNTSTDGCTVEMASAGGTPFGECYVMRSLTAAGSENDTSGTDWMYAVDGLSSTGVTLDQSDNVLHVQTCNFDNVDGSSLNGSSLNVYVHVFWGTVTGTDYHTVDYQVNAGGWRSGNNAINYLDSGWVTVFNLSTATIDELEDINSLEIRVTQNTDAANTIEIKNIVVRAKVESLDNSTKYMYVRCQGREFSGTWDSRRTAGNLIENPIDVLESLLRDEMSLSCDYMDLDSIDLIHNFWGVANIVSHASFYQQQNWKTLLKDFCQAHMLSIIPNYVNKLRLVTPIAAQQYWANGISSVTNTDIFIDTIAPVSNAYAQNPIQKHSVKWSRSGSSNVFPKVTLKYETKHDGFLQSVSNGSGLEKVINNKYIGETASATILVGYMQHWYSSQKMIVNFDSFYNAIGFELGDVINIRHGDLTDNMCLDGTETSQKWQILSIKPYWHPNVVNITAIELT